MTLEHPPGAIRFMFRVKMQHDACDVAPVSAFRIRVEQAQIRDEVLLVVSGQYGIGGRGIDDIGIKRRLLHGLSRNMSRTKDVLYSRERTSSGRMQRSEANRADVIDMICRQGWHL